MLIEVIAIGKLKDRGLEQLCATYVKRVQPFAKVSVVEARSTAALRKRLASLHGGATVLLDERGQQPTTKTFAEWITSWRQQNFTKVALCIGDAHGFTDADRRAATHLLGLSRLTLPHRLARLILLEQLYRACSLLAGHPYHHDG